MSVPFTQITFRNTNNIDVTLTIEAPAGNRVAGPTNVPANSPATTNPNVKDCPSVVFRVVSDGDPDEETQTFAVLAPSPFKPWM
jgi:hypothetical protein